jgi:hypothetical protein
MYRRFIVLLGMFLGSLAPAAAQTPTPQIVLAQANVATDILMRRTASGPLLTSSFQLFQDPGRSPAHFSHLHLFAGPNEHDQNMERLPAIQQVKTLFFTRSSLSLLQLWSGRLRVDGFTGSLNMLNVQLGPSAAGGLHDFRPPRQGYPGGPRSAELYGLSLSFHFGRDARMGRPPQPWRYASRMVTNVLK